MSVQVTFELPAEVEERLARDCVDLNAEVKEAYVLDLFRRGKLTHYELSRALGYDRFETDTFLQKRHVVEGTLTMADLEADRQTLERLIRKHADARSC